MQGPFTLDHLRGWRGSLPMDLPVLQLTEPQPDSQAASSAAAQATGEGDSQAEGQSSGSRWVPLELARLLGDDELLGRWRLEHPEQVCSQWVALASPAAMLAQSSCSVRVAGMPTFACSCVEPLPQTAPPCPLPAALQAAWPGSAPPAEWYELERQQGTAQSLADAVLWGLPAHDATVAVARVAAASGRSLHEVLEWNRQVDYTATAYRVAARGRIQAPGGPVGAGRWWVAGL